MMMLRAGVSLMLFFALYFTENTYAWWSTPLKVLPLFRDPSHRLIHDWKVLQLVFAI